MNKLAIYRIVFIVISLMIMIVWSKKDIESFQNCESNATESNTTPNLLPKGAIIAWSGTSPPEGWAICDGSRGTPDLRGRFILGMGKSSDLENRVLNDTGGSENHKLSVDELPSHSHRLPTGEVDERWGISHAGRKSLTKGRHLRNTGSSGGNKPHNNMPPFYVLAWIMKIEEPEKAWFEKINNQFQEWQSEKQEFGKHMEQLAKECNRALQLTGVQTPDKKTDQSAPKCV